MKNSYHLITLASWEDRFVLGTSRFLQTSQPDHIHILFMDEYFHLSGLNVNLVEKGCRQSAIDFSTCGLSFKSPHENWIKISAIAHKIAQECRHVTLDISTMPREVIWTLLWHLKANNLSISYIYNRPTDYCPEWLSRDPERPRMLYQMSGLAKLGTRTILIILAGYDPERTAQIINFYEPEVTFLGLQVGATGSTNNMRMDSHLTYVRREFNVKKFPVDAYSPDRGYSAIIDNINNNIKNHNILMTSLGPKLSAISLFKAHIEHPETALFYAPSRDFNPNYSSGIGEAITGSL